MGSKCQDSLNKSKMPSHCGFPLANPHKGSILDCVPESNLLNWLILLFICLVNLKSSRPFLLGGLNFMRSLLPDFSVGVK